MHLNDAAQSSISLRLTAGVTLVLLLFMGLGGFSLDRIYQQRAINSLQNELLTHLYGLLSAAEEDTNGLPVFSETVTDPRLNQPDSGLYAMVSDAQGTYRWVSMSLLGESLAQEFLSPGEKRYRHDEQLLQLDYGIAWDDLQGQPRHYTFSVASSLQRYTEELKSFRNSLFGWLGGSVAVLLVVQVMLLRWGLAPLRRAARDIKRIEEGQLEKLEGTYPAELAVLTNNLNSLLAQRQQHLQRYRNALGDLAHSLKTPLALLQSAREEQAGDALRQTLDEQLPQIDTLVQYQLQRAAVMGQSVLLAKVAVRPLLDRLVRGFAKIYHEHALQFQVAVDSDVYFQGDEKDLTELLGNLIDNACKYGNRRIYIEVQGSPCRLIRVEDDGPGIAAEDRQRLLQRGMRADEKMPGQGIGLDIVNEIVASYQARLTVTDSRLGGAAFIIEL